MNSTPQIRPLAICLFQRDDKILVAEYFDPGKNQHFFRPIGGGIEFGERAAAAIVREMMEELSAAVRDVRYLFTLENIFVFNGKPGHEIVLVHDGVFIDESLYAREVIAGQETNGGAFQAFWKSRRELQEDARPLYPSGLLERLSEI